MKGFTLLEVMIALVIIALVMSAYIKVSGKSAANLFYLENKTFGLWLAEDIASQIQSGKISLPKNASELSGDQMTFDKKFHWKANFQGSKDRKSVRAEIVVSLDSSKNHTVLSRYVTYFIPG